MKPLLVVALLLACAGAPPSPTVPSCGYSYCPPYPLPEPLCRTVHVISPCERDETSLCRRDKAGKPGDCICECRNAEGKATSRYRE